MQQETITELASEDDFSNTFDTMLDSLKERKPEIDGILVITYNRNGVHDADMLGSFEILGSLALDCAEALLQKSKPVDESSNIILLN